MIRIRELVIKAEIVQGTAKPDDPQKNSRAGADRNSDSHGNEQFRTYFDKDNRTRRER